MSDDRAQRIGELTAALNRVDSRYGALFADNLFYHSHVTADLLPELSFQQLCALDVPVRSASRIAAMYHKEEKVDPYKEWQKARQERIRQLREYQVQFGSVPWGGHWVPLILYVLIVIISGILGFHVWKANPDLVKAGIGLAFGIAGFCTSFIKSVYCAVALDGGWFTIAVCFHKVCGLLRKLIAFTTPQFYLFLLFLFVFFSMFIWVTFLFIKTPSPSWGLLVFGPLCLVVPASQCLSNFMDWRRYRRD